MKSFRMMTAMEMCMRMCSMDVRSATLSVKGPDLV